MQGGPQLWVSQILYAKGQISTNRIWEEYTSDQNKKFNKEGEEVKDCIPSKHFLKTKVLPCMQAQGSIERCRAADIPKWKKSGWRVIPNKAFKNTDPAIMAKLDPIPKIHREDYKAHLRQENIPYEF